MTTANKTLVVAILLIIGQSNQLSAKDAKHVFKGHKNRITAIGFGGNKILLSADRKGKVWKWDLIKGTGQEFLELPDKQILRMDVSPKANLVGIVAAPQQKTQIPEDIESVDIHVFDLKTGKQLWKTTLSNDMEFLAFSPDGKFVAIACSEKYTTDIQLLDSKTSKRVALLQGEDSHPEDLVFAPNGVNLAVIDREYVIRTWDIDSRKIISEIYPRDKKYKLMGIAFSPDSSLMATSELNLETTQLWDWKAKKVVKELNAACHDQRCLAFSSDGRWFATHRLRVPERLILFKKSMGNYHKVAVNIGEADNKIAHVCFSPDSALLVIAEEEKLIRVFDVTEEE
jgi:WD40 repeat protein